MRRQNYPKLNKKTTLEYSNITFKKQGPHTKVIGEIKNNMDRSFSTAHFKITVYDKDKNILDSSNILIPNLSSGQNKTFYTYIINILPNQIKYYKLQFEQ